MIVRKRGTGVPQPEHAHLAGQVAAHWGAWGDYPEELRGDLVSATHHHDDGWLAWEQSPTLDSRGVPINFDSLPLEEHLAIWRRGIELAARRSPFQELMVSRHAAHLYDAYPRERPAGEQAQLDRFLDEHRERQERLAIEPAAMERGTELLSIWDGISLFLCAKARVDTTVGPHRLRCREGRVVLDGLSRPFGMEIQGWDLRDGWEKRRPMSLRWSFSPP